MGGIDQNPQTPEIESLWKVARRSGLSRRRFLQLMAVGGTASVLAACARSNQGTTPTAAEGEQAPAAGDEQTEATPPPEERFVKDVGPFIDRGTNLETRLENMTGWITPGALFFVRSHTPTPRIDVNTWRLKIEGDSVGNPMEISYEDLRKMPSRTVATVVECAGNMRNFFKEEMGQEASGGEWLTGGVSNAVWTGVPLSYILDLAQVTGDAQWVNIKGLDTENSEGGMNKPITIEKARDPDTIMAYAMNGEDIPPDNGYPVRSIVPGWVGSTNIKWAGLVMVSKDPFWVKNNTDSYVLIGPEWPEEQYAPAKGAPIMENVIRSALALPWPAEVRAGQQVVRGYAWSPVAPIRTVEWSADDGQSWQEARIVSPNMPYAWTEFEFDWDAPAGDHILRSRATDEEGNAQPESIPFNEKGYLYNVPVRHPVRVQ